MTGFARTDGSAQVDTPESGAPVTWGWAWEIRSVNAKGLDVRCRVPGAAERLEPRIRERAQARLGRGSVTASWSVTRADETGPSQLKVNEGFLRQVLALQEGLEAQGLVFPTAPRLDQLLAIRGVVEMVEQFVDETVIAAIEPAAMADLDRALEALVESRGREGERLSAVVTGLLDEIARLTGAAAEAAEAQPGALRRRIEEQLALLLAASPPVSEERLAQELALLATKADVREETDRLTAHVAACRELLAGGGPVGRKLDFLCQELNREANTVCSKATDLALTNIGVELKAQIERFREQVQNIE